MATDRGPDASTGPASDPSQNSAGSSAAERSAADDRSAPDGGPRSEPPDDSPPEPPTVDLPPAFETYATDELPNATPRGHGKDGVLEATFARSGDGPTRLVRDRAEVPLHHTGTLDHDPLGPTLCVQEPTGGVAQGDRHRIAVAARAGSRAAVTTQAATKVHSMHSDYAHLDASLRVAPGAHVEYVPGATIVNEDARCLQTVRVALAAGASAIVADVLVTDGLSEHDPFGFDHYHARLEAEREGELCCADAVDLRPEERDPRDPAGVGEHTVVGSLYALAPDAAGASEGATGEAVDETGVDELAVDEPDEVVRGATTDAASTAGVGRCASLDGPVADLADRIHERLAAGSGEESGERGGEATDGNGGVADSVGGSAGSVDAGASVLPFEAGVGVRVLGSRSVEVRRALAAARDEARRALLGVGLPDDRRCRP